MADNTAPATLAEMRNALLRNVSDQESVTATNNNADRYLNVALQQLHIAPGNWYWAIRRAMIVTHEPYSTGTIGITAAARTTVSGSGTAWNTAVTGFGFNNARAGGVMLFGDNELIRVSSVASDTSMTLETIYTGAAISGTAYRYVEDEYALAADFHRPVDVSIFSTPRNIPLVGVTQFNRSTPRNDITGAPRTANWFQLAFSGSAAQNTRVRFNPVPDRAYSIPYDYYTTNLAVSTTGTAKAQMTADTDEPIIPLIYRNILVDAASDYWLTYLDDDITKSNKIQAKWVAEMLRAVGDVVVGQDRPQLVMKRGGARGIASGRYDIGNVTGNPRFYDIGW